MLEIVWRHLVRLGTSLAARRFQCANNAHADIAHGLMKLAEAWGAETVAIFERFQGDRRSSYLVVIRPIAPL